MPGDAASNNDDDLVSQIDELKARMDRLMKGGTSTSNSALLTDAPKAPPAPEAEPAPAPPPQRSRVRDLIGPDDPDLRDAVAVPRDAVVFPDEKVADERPTDRPSEDRPPNPPQPPPRPSSNPSVSGSLISVDEAKSEKRPKVESFDDLGSAIEEELARDASVPPSRKGPDLASRFGSPDDEPAVDQQPDSEPQPEPEPEAVVATDPEAEVEELEDEYFEPVEERSKVGAIVAIWAFTAVTSGTIATLHFTGVI